MYFFRRKSCKVLPPIIVILACLILFYYSYTSGLPFLEVNQSEPREPVKINTDGASRRDLIHAIQKMTALSSKTQELSDYIRGIEPDIKGFENDTDLRATSKQLEDYLQVSDEQILDLKQLHERVLEHMPSRLREGEYTGKGIVMSADGSYFPTALANVAWIRNRNYTLPIEIYIPYRRSWEAACNDFLPSLNVRCKCLEELYGESLLNSFKVPQGKEGYLYKGLSILMSDFDEIYWMDPDSLPLIDVEEGLNEPLFQDIGYIFTSDYWPRLTSPYFYDITNVTLGPDDFGTGKKLLQVDRENAISGLSTESGQFFVKKSQHFKSLVLSVYYNLRGSIWWPLLTQGGPGEGDKEVWPAAAQVLGEPWYQTHTQPLTAGYRQNGDKDEFHGMCMIQPEFSVDHRTYDLGRTKTPPKYMALHFNMLKLNVQRVLRDNGGKIPPFRYLGNVTEFQKSSRINSDIELEMWTAVRDSTCKWAVEKKLVPNDWESLDSARHYCEILEERIQFLAKYPEVPILLSAQQ